MRSWYREALGRVSLSVHILLVRHGETDWNREGRYQGRTDTELSAHGLRQVAMLGQALVSVPITRAISSPLRRAQHTAEAIVNGRLPLELDERLMEISHGAWEGRLAAEIAEADAAALAAWQRAPTENTPAGPGAETLADVQARAWPALAGMVRSLGPEDTGLVVTHDAVLRVFLCRILGLPWSQVWSFRQDPAALNVLSGSSLETLSVTRLNSHYGDAPILGTAAHRAL